ncbi:toprim domain-containing protein [Salmonella enterica]
MANFFTDLNNYIKQNPLAYMHKFGIEIKSNGHMPCPVCGGVDRFIWRNKGQYANTGFCRNKDAHGGYNTLQPLSIISAITKFKLEDIGSHIGFNQSCRYGNPKHFVMRSAPEKPQKHEHVIKPVDTDKLASFLKVAAVECKNATWRESPYLLKKGISKMMWVGGHGQTLLPYYRADGTYCALQRIPLEGKKPLVADSQMSGAFYYESNTSGVIETIFIGEGLGTVAAVQSIMSDLNPSSLFITAWSANNLLNVAKEARRCYPNAAICILTDNDVSNKGINAAKKIIDRVSNCWWAMPETTGEDWCDVFQRGKSAFLNEFRRVLKNSKPTI